MNFKTFGKKYWVLILAILLIVLGSTFFVKERRDGSMGKTAGSRISTLPEFHLQDLWGREARSSDLKGKVILVNFWATWCPPCLYEIPHFVELHEKYSREGLIILGISMDQSGKEHVKSFVEEKGIPYQTLMGDDKIVEDFGGIQGLPTTFVIDREGKIAEKLVGYHDFHAFESVIKDLL